MQCFWQVLSQMRHPLTRTMHAECTRYEVSAISWERMEVDNTFCSHSGSFSISNEVLQQQSAQFELFWLGLFRFVWETTILVVVLEYSFVFRMYWYSNIFS